VAPSGSVAELDDNIAEACRIEEERHSFDRSRLEMMRAYAEHDGCRRSFILSYFGEPYEGPCGNCDNCESGRVAQSQGSSRPFGLGARVLHGRWGAGVVQRYDADQMVVLFDSVGYKQLGVALVLDRNLLTLEESK
jgi:ATP-dependent DNA helicase RecQ